jgi:hypothetical protein
LNDTYTPPGAGAQEIPCPIPAISDILGVRSTMANSYLVACGLLVLNPTHQTLSPNKQAWESLKGLYQLEIELEQSQDIHFLGPKKQYFLRIGCLVPHNNNTTFSAKDQAKRYLKGDVKNGHTYEKGWEPKRMRATRQQNEFVCSTACDLTVFLAEKLPETDPKADDDSDMEENAVPYLDEDDDSDDDDDIDNSKMKENATVLPVSPPTKVVPILLGAPADVGEEDEGVGAGDESSPPKYWRIPSLRS